MTIFGKRNAVIAAALMATLLATAACAQLLGLSSLDEGPDLPEGGTTDAPTSLLDGGADGDAANPASHCSNDKQDEDETDINCGGATCGKCAKGQKCLMEADCAKTCLNKVCSGCAGIDIFDSGGCIDSTEVHVRDYDAFLKKGAPGRVEDERCRNLAIVTPDNFAEQLTHPDWPVRRVDWCSAKAFCKSRGEKLCGPFGSTRLTQADLGDATKDQWMAACTGLQRTEYPYDSTYNDDRCNGADKKLGMPWDAGFGVDCKTVGIFVYDLSGNVAEWEDACENRNNRDECVVRGGSYLSDGGFLKCSAADPRPPTNRTDDVGFRCCE